LLDRLVGRAAGPQWEVPAATPLSRQQPPDDDPVVHARNPAIQEIDRPRQERLVAGRGWAS
jgi:hypothetical protein